MPWPPKTSSLENVLEQAVSNETSADRAYGHSGEIYDAQASKNHAMAPAVVLKVPESFTKPLIIL